MKQRLINYLAVLVFSTIPFLSGCNSFVYSEGGRGYWGGWALGGGRGCGAGCDSSGGQPYTVLSSGIDDSAALLARDYGIKLDSAQKIIALASGKLSRHTFREIGLVSKDLRAFHALRKLEMPSESTLQRISSALGEEHWRIHNIIRDFISDISQRN